MAYSALQIVTIRHAKLEVPMKKNDSMKAFEQENQHRFLSHHTRNVCVFKPLSFQSESDLHFPVSRITFELSIHRLLQSNTMTESKVSMDNFPSALTEVLNNSLHNL